jgi:hypothetical protein
MNTKKEPDHKKEDSDGGNFGLGCLSFIFPIIGFILFIVYYAAAVSSGRDPA